jgi:hypothetical protein
MLLGGIVHMRVPFRTLASDQPQISTCACTSNTRKHQIAMLH